jgi:hypothetical protein
MRAYMMQLMARDEDKRYDWEKSLVKEIVELKQIEEDIKALDIALTREEEDAVIIPEFIMDEKIREEAR